MARGSKAAPIGIMPRFAFTTKYGDGNKYGDGGPKWGSDGSSKYGGQKYNGTKSYGDKPYQKKEDGG